MVLDTYIIDKQISTFGAQLRAAREALGLTQEELGSRVNASPTTIARLERDEQVARFDLFKALVEELNQDPKYFMGSGLPKKAAKLELFELIAKLDEMSARHAIKAIRAIVEPLVSPSEKRLSKDSQQLLNKKD